MTLLDPTHLRKEVPPMGIYVLALVTVSSIVKALA
jgi:hypothetical protein